MKDTTTDNDRLIATSLAEAEQHRIYFRDLVKTNEGLQEHLTTLTTELDEREKHTAATEERQRNTTKSQDAKAVELSSREAQLKDDEGLFASAQELFSSEKAQGAAKDKERSEALDNRERDISAREVAHHNAVTHFEATQAKTLAEATDREARLTAKQEQLTRDAAALAERERTYKEQAEKEIVERLTKNLSK